MFMQYLDETVLDHSCGSWFHQLDAHNQLKETVWPRQIRYLSCAAGNADPFIRRSVYRSERFCWDNVQIGKEKERQESCLSDLLYR